MFLFEMAIPEGRRVLQGIFPNINVYEHILLWLAKKYEIR